MAAITFKTGQELRFFQTLRNRVNTYFREQQVSPKANARMVMKTIVLLCAYIFPFAVLLIFPIPFVGALGIWMIMGAAKAGVGMSVMHDANHGAYSSSDRVNKMIAITMNIIGGISSNWKVQHNLLHHTYTNITGVDEDIDTNAVLRLSPHIHHKWIHKAQWWYAFLIYAISTLHWILVKDFKQYFTYRKEGLHRTATGLKRVRFIEVLALKSAYLFTFIGLPILLGIPFWQVLIGFVVMHVVCGLILSIVFQLAHVVEETAFPMPDDRGNMEDTWAVHQLRTTMNFACRNKWLSWYVGGLNFQVEHHLFSRICHVHYAALAPIVRRTAQEFGFPYKEQRTLVGALNSHIRVLRTRGRVPLDEIMG